METIAVQGFEPPIDLTHCDKVLVAVTHGEKMPVLVSMQLMAEGSVEDGGTEVMGMKLRREEELQSVAGGGESAAGSRDPPLVSAAGVGPR